MSDIGERSSLRLTAACWPVLEFLTNFVRQVKHGTVPEPEQVRYEAGAATLLDVNSLRTQRVDAAVKVEESRFALFVTRLGVTYQDGTINSFLLEKLQTPIPGLTQP